MSTIAQEHTPAPTPGTEPGPPSSGSDFPVPPAPRATIEAIIALALAEDAPHGDVTAQGLIPATATATAQVVARVPGVLAGTGVFAEAMRQADPDLAVTAHLADGEAFEAGAVLLSVSGPARGLLLGERVGLNLLQRLSGIATATSRLVGLVSAAGGHARVADTRKTTPGLRVLERYAVRCGGGSNHRDSLSEAVMAKDNHLALLGDGKALTEALLAAKARWGHTVHVEVEVDRFEQIDPVLAAGVDTIMLDNFSLEDTARAVKHIAGRAIVEASGTVSEETIGAIAATGVDVISSGAITHSVRALDLGLDLVVSAAP
ncbi:carboxylating nicotinate-nucleotide diphosphorylase [Galactobacter valiniphilus]|uniref:Nicotinate-nucleotide pyrophosphorylase [carboxylating] n=1 Tax=Galactobacter valiniphilus TaxID=2676122 RepID=A0A399JFD8_9MICC|nr:carboxylating nicotinate-nucleotide diphosphorylase [Galactobacter valiniphilus]RII42899.1 carboxylating nicotinate-nucleotide diphosphorylase [Galactobacter valiniphilus]